MVVLSAQGDTTDDLIEKAREINPRASKREMDMLLSTGEQISIALCAMALEDMGLPVVSLAAWQVGIQTTSAYSDARIKKIDPERIQRELVSLPMDWMMASTLMPAFPSRENTRKATPGLWSSPTTAMRAMLVSFATPAIFVFSILTTSLTFVPGFRSRLDTTSIFT